MTKKFVLTVMAACFGAASCSKGPAPSPSNVAAGSPVSRDATAGGAAKPQPAAAAPSAASAAPQAPAIPAGAEWTIYCATIPGVGHIQQSTQLRDQLIKGTGMRDWYVIHGANESTLYYGFYKSVEKAKPVREKIDAMTDASGGRPFRNALTVELTAPDPEAPPQWDLANAPAGMVWSVQIAAYEGSPQRKKYAVDAVRDARAQGVPAYYFHGPSISSVCVGAWPNQAVRGDMEPAFNDPNERRTMDQIMQQQPADLIVLPPGMPVVNKEIRTKRGRMRAVSPQLEVVDPTMLATMKNFPHHYRNGEPEGQSTKNGVQPKPSFLVKIGRRGGSLLGGPGEPSLAGAGQDAPVAGPLRPSRPAPGSERRPAPSQPGYGKLPSLGGN